MSERIRLGREIKNLVGKVTVTAAPLLGGVQVGSEAVKSATNGQTVKAAIEGVISVALFATPWGARRLIQRANETGRAIGREEGFRRGLLTSEFAHHPELRDELERQVRARTMTRPPETQQPSFFHDPESGDDLPIV